MLSHVRPFKRQDLSYYKGLKIWHEGFYRPCANQDNFKFWISRPVPTQIQNLIFKAIFERHIKAPDFDIFLADKNIYVSSKPKLS